jgi:hypothetical protein
MVSPREAAVGGGDAPHPTHAPGTAGAAPTAVQGVVHANDELLTVITHAARIERRASVERALRRGRCSHRGSAPDVHVAAARNRPRTCHLTAGRRGAVDHPSRLRWVLDHGGVAVGSGWQLRSAVRGTPEHRHTSGVAVGPPVAVVVHAARRQASSTTRSVMSSGLTTLREAECCRSSGHRSSRKSPRDAKVMTLNMDPAVGMKPETGSRQECR